MSAPTVRHASTRPTIHSVSALEKRNPLSARSASPGGQLRKSAVSRPRRRASARAVAQHGPLSGLGKTIHRGHIHSGQSAKCRHEDAQRGAVAPQEQGSTRPRDLHHGFGQFLLHPLG